MIHLISVVLQQVLLQPALFLVRILVKTIT
jgi:hypothetical protein